MVGKMKHGTAIEWTHVPGYKGETWNPWVGCSPVGPGCENCWAARQACRFQNTRRQYEGTVRNGKWTGRINRAPDPQFYKPLHWRDPRAVFPCSMSDFFHEGADEFREFAWHSIYEARQHLYLILTKRPERIPDCLPSFGKREWPWPHVWLGATVENQEMADKRIPELLKVQAAVRFLSIEPMLGPINLRWKQKIAMRRRGLYLIDTSKALAEKFWIICGGESGPGARPMHPDWARGVRDQCTAAGVPFFFKQWGEWMPVVEMYSDELDDAMATVCAREAYLDQAGGRWENDIAQPPPGTYIFERVGKKRAGCLLDGCEHKEFPL